MSLNFLLNHDKLFLNFKLKRKIVRLIKNRFIFKDMF